MVNAALLIGIGMGGVAALMNIIGTAIPYWLVYPHFEPDHFIGLFRICIKHYIDFTNDSTTICVSLGPDDLPHWWKATQAMMLLSIIAMCSGVLLAITFGFVMKDKQFLAFGAAIMTAFGIVMVFIGVMIFGLKLGNTIESRRFLHAGFGLVTAAAIFDLPAIMFMFVSKDLNTPTVAIPKEFSNM